MAIDFEQVIITVICGCVKRVHLVTDDGLYDGKAFYTVKIVFFSSSKNDGEFINYCGYLFPGYLFPDLFANQILICFMSAAHVSAVLSPLHLRCVG